MTFDDVAEVNVDFDDNTFVIIRKNGAVNGAYNLDTERELWNRLYDARGEFPIYSLSTEEVDEYGNRYYVQE